MQTTQDALLIGGLIVQFVLIVAAFGKGNIQVCYAFFFYLVAGFASTIAVSYFISSPEGKRVFYVGKELLLDIIKIALLLEVNRRVFRFYPRVLRSNRTFFALAAAFLLLYIWLVPPENLSWWGAVPLDFHSKIMQTYCFIFFVFVGSILYYRLHIEPRYKFLLLGFVLSQFPLALGFAVAATFGEKARGAMSLLNSTFFVLALLVWTKVYFRRDKSTDRVAVAASRLDHPPGSGAPE